MCVFMALHIALLKHDWLFGELHECGVPNHLSRCDRHSEDWLSDFNGLDFVYEDRQNLTTWLFE